MESGTIASKTGISNRMVESPDCAKKSADSVDSYPGSLYNYRNCKVAFKLAP